MKTQKRLRQFVDMMFAGKKRQTLFSFKYNGNILTSSTLKSTVEKIKNTEEFEHFKVTYQIDSAGLKIVMDIKTYYKFNVVECLPYIINTGDSQSGIIEDFNTLDITPPLPEQDYVSLTNKILTGTKLDIRYNLGSYSAANDFVAQKRELWTRPGVNRFHMESSEGRSSASFLPYFGVDEDDLNGLNIGVGWSGAWQAGIEILIDNNAFCQGKDYRISLSMLKTRFYLQPKEKLRQVGFFIQFRSDKTVRKAQNELRQFMLMHHSPHDSKGELMKAPVSMMTWGGLSSEEMLERINAIAQHNLPYEAFWVDAGWSGFPGKCPHFLNKEAEFPSDWGIRVGNWDINTVPHPNGLRPVSNASRKAGMKFLAWFEPERVHKECQGKILKEHPEWLIEIDDPSLLYNLGNTDALEAIFQTLKTLINDEGIDIYREDFNFNTLPYWRKNDDADRIGVSEMKHVEGHYQLWEMLHQEFPDMLIDNCASGGRRLDFMSLTHSIPLCQSDYTCFLDYNVECVQTENFYLNDWIPLHTGFTWMPEYEAYDFFSCAGTGVSNKIWQYGSRRIPIDHDWEWHRKMLEHNIKMRNLSINGDYYPLTEKAENLSRWCASQMHDPKSHAGYVLAFRREQNLESKMIFRLQGIDLEASYFLTWLDGKSLKISGKKLQTELEVTMPNPRSVVLIYYKKI